MATSIDALDIQISAKATSANNAINRLTKNLDKLSTSLNGLNVSNVGGLSTVANQTNAVASGSTKMNNALKKTNTTMRTTTKNAWSLAKAFGKFYANYFLIIRGAKALWGSIESTADYIEAYNYYNVAFGKIASEWQQDFTRFGYDNAEAYADSFVGRMNETLGKLSGVQISVGADGKGLLTDTGMKNLGLNIQEVTQYASQLASVTNSLGQTGETSLAISQSFTKLAGDISSLFNVDYSTVAQNLQSGLIGQSRALYKYGIDITNATLQTYAYKLGLTKAVSEMTQAEKQQLRTIAILDQSKVSWGDLANTINSPSNMIRQLTTNLKEAGMVLGQLFIPMLGHVLPIVNGATIALKRLITEIAGFFGVEIDFEKFGQGSNELEEDNSNLSDSYDDLANSIEEVKSQLLGFDEVNKLSDTSATLSVGTEDNTIDLTDEIVSATEEYQKVWDEAFANMENTSQKWAGRIQKALEGVGDVFEDFAIGDFFKAGEDVSQLVIDFNNFIARALKDVDWEGIGTSFGSFMRGIKWGEIFISLKDVISEAWNGLWDAWFSSLKESPFETLLITSIALMKVDGIRNALLEKLSGMTGLEIGKMTPLKIGAYAAITLLGVEIAQDIGEKIGELITSNVPDPTIYFNIRAEHDKQMESITREFAGLNKEAQTYLDLSSRYDELTDEEKGYVKQMADDLNANVNGITNNIDAISGEWLATNEELEKAIENQMFYTKLAASQDYLQGLYQELYKKQAELIELHGDYAAIGEGNLFGLLWTPWEMGEAWATENAIDAAESEIDMINGLITQTESQIKYFTNQINDTGKKGLTNLGFAAFDWSEDNEELSNYLQYLGDMKKSFDALSNKASKFGRITSGLSAFKMNIVDFKRAGQEIDVFVEKYSDSEVKAGFSTNNIANGLNYASSLINIKMLDWNSLKIRPTLSSNAIMTGMQALQTSYKAQIDGMNSKKVNPQISTTSVMNGINTIKSSYTDSVNKMNALKTIPQINTTAFSAGITSAMSIFNTKMANLTSKVKFAEDEDSLFGLKNRIQKAFENLKLTISVGAGAGALAGLNIKQYAIGGYPDIGQLFIANEAGPELVGNIGGRPAVANSDQITQAIAQSVAPAVYNAVVSAMQTSRGGNSDVVVNIDGKQVFKAVQKQANNYVAQTGQTPFPI